MASSSTPSIPPVAFVRQVLDAPSRMSVASVNRLRHCIVPEYGFELVVCDVADRANTLGGTRALIVYRDQLRLGLRFPLCLELVAILDHFGIILAQLMPNALASAMAFIVYLRRRGIPWSLGLFCRFFSCRVSAGGYVVFATCTAHLKITGLDNKLKDWKSYYCWVRSPVDWPVPVKPKDSKALKPSGGLERQKDLWGVSLDVRQYIQDPDVLMGVLYPGPFAAIGEDRWRELDELWRVVPVAESSAPVVGSPAPVEVGSGSSSEGCVVSLVRTLPLQSRAAAAQLSVPDEASFDDPLEDPVLQPSVDAVILVAGECSRPSPVVSAEGVADEVLEVALPEGGTCSEGPGERVQDLMEESSPLSPHRRCTTDEAALPEVRASHVVEGPKVFLSAGGEMAHVRLTQDWYPAGESNLGAPLSLGAVLASAAFDHRIRELPWECLRDEAASFHAASWRLCDYYAGMCEDLQAERRRLEEQVKDLGGQVLAVEQRCATAREEACEKDAELSRFQSLVTDQSRAQKAAYEALSEQCKKQQQELESVSERKYALMRSAIAFCTRQLIGVGALYSEWRDPDKVIALAEDPGVASDLADGEESLGQGGGSSSGAGDGPTGI